MPLSHIFSGKNSINMTVSFNRQLLQLLSDIVSCLCTLDKNTPNSVPKSTRPNLTFHPNRIVRCDDKFAHLSKNFWNLLVRLVAATNRVVSLVDLYFNDESLDLPALWDQMAHPEPSSLRSMASRLSKRLREAGIPYRVSYSGVTGAFLLVEVPPTEESGERPQADATRPPCFATKDADELWRMLKSLDAMLQKNESASSGPEPL